MRKTFIAGNWKMHKTVSEAVALAKELVPAADGNSRYLIAPPFTALSAVGEVVKGTPLLLGAQNMSNAESGAHTGEVSVHMLKDVGVKVVILGHSERRLIYGEKDAFINEKVKLALDNDLEVILCVGETLEQREAGEVEQVVRTQVEGGLKGIPEGFLDKVTIAYEPVWAIGTGKTATPEDADAVHAFIRKVIKELYGDKAAEAMVIQYGGSVKPGNVKELMAMKNIDGALVGGAALKAETFVPIMKYDS
ncbi:triose-phosphate isomerase [Sediminispirochaeta bajacaliforniensis]|uniref:triose-phosphate isomerase n=1 Tax=Sediminispirochaeta bajacaliforniensis TaxID=148 RepID=UPI00037D55E2|nr:triose-phosphate isomerase [Sediminispirochaeta bajacaliforniensis]